MSTNSPIFIVGPPRSGTTLTAKILGRHPNIFIPGETHFFEDIYSRKQELGNIDSIDTKEKIYTKLSTLYERYYELHDQHRIDDCFLTVEKEVILNDWDSYESILTSFMTCQMIQEGKSRWGNNAPRDIFYVDEILKFYPDAKFIICYRDGRDFLASYKTRSLVATESHQDRIRRLYHPIITSVLWKSSIKQLLHVSQLIEEKNYMLMKYEDLVNYPEESAKRMCNAVGEVYFPEMLGIETNNSSALNNDKGIFTSSIGRWVNELSHTEIFLMECLASKELERMGYVKGCYRPNWIEVGMLAFKVPVSLIDALSANRKMIGPILPYLLRRLKAIVT